MPLRLRLLIPCSLALILGAAACTEELPGAMKAIPADADMVGTLDTQAALAYAKSAMPKLVPASLSDEVPSFQALAKQAMQLAGVDLDKLGPMTFYSYADGQRAAFIIAGLDAEGLKGEKSGDHKGRPVYTLMGDLHYAPLGELGLVFSPDRALLDKTVDTLAGDAKCLGDAERGKLLRKMLEIHEKMDLLRVYVLTDELPGTEGIPFKFDGGAMFLDLDQGAAVTLLTDKAGADKIDQAVGMGLMGLQTALMMGGGKDMPVEIDKATKTMVGEMLGKIRRQKKSDRIIISYAGDLKPLVEKMAGLGVKAVAGRATAPGAAQPISPPAKRPAPAAPAPDAAKAPATQ
jgi:hypothetical protein